jgi:hypothetical protein
VQVLAPDVLYRPALQMEAVAEVEPAGQKYLAHQQWEEMRNRCMRHQHPRPRSRCATYPAVQGPVQAAVVRPAVAPYRPAGQGAVQAATAIAAADP